ncbi:MAG: class I SAM-dependent methyltransferase [Cyanobacteria bacterium P01_H01_bin.74]
MDHSSSSIGLQSIQKRQHNPVEEALQTFQAGLGITPFGITEQYLLTQTLVQLYPQLKWRLRPVFKWFAQPILSAHFSALPMTGVRRIVEIGCDSGLLSNQLSLQYPDIEIVGIDSHGSAIEKARATVRFRQQKLKFICADPMTLPAIPCDRIIFNNCMPTVKTVTAMAKLIEKTVPWLVSQGDVVFHQKKSDLITSLMNDNCFFATAISRFFRGDTVHAPVKMALIALGFPKADVFSAQKINQQINLRVPKQQMLTAQEALKSLEQSQADNALLNKNLNKNTEQNHNQSHHQDNQTEKPWATCLSDTQIEIATQAFQVQNETPENENNRFQHWLDEAKDNQLPEIDQTPEMDQTIDFLFERSCF